MPDVSLGKIDPDGFQAVTINSAPICRRQSPLAGYRRAFGSVGRAAAYAVQEIVCLELAIAPGVHAVDLCLGGATT